MCAISHRRKIPDEILIADLLTAAPLADIAKKNGVSELTIKKYIAEPSFREKYSKAKEDVLERCTTLIQSRCNRAVESMVSILEDEGNSAQTRLNAAEAILRYALKLTEQFCVLNRLEALENQIEEIQVSMK